MDYTEVRRKHGLHRREKKAWTTQKREESMDYTEQRRKDGLHAQNRVESMDYKKREEKVQQYNSIIMM